MTTVVTTLVIVAAFVMAGLRLAGHRRRRLLFARWCRLTRWEHWPLWLFYAPVAVFVFLLGLRHRGLTLVTAVNPGLDQGGVGLVSKGKLLDQLQRAGGCRVARFTLIEPEAPAAQKRSRLADFMAANALDYPIVLKPNFGERGRAVCIVADESEALACLDRSREPMLAQEYVPGREYGVYYLRDSGAAKGIVLSLTSKDAAYVVGDGTRTLETLILDDPRLVSYAHLFFREFATRLGDIVPVGERFILTELRSHWRGALFTEAEELRSPALERAFEALSAAVDGFHVGRYDVRAPSPEAMRLADGFRIIELNSVMAEPLHMYDARYGLFGAYRIMFGLWRRIIAIGAGNRKRGARPLGLRQFMAMIGAYRAHRRAQAEEVGGSRGD